MIVKLTSITVSATFDVKKNIYNLACNPYGTQIAVVENLGVFDQTEESSVRLYDVGRKRDDEDEVVSQALSGRIFLEVLPRGSSLIKNRL